MNELHEDDDDMRCQIFLRHRDGQKLRELYEKIIESSDADADSFVSSEAAKDFMARLRIAIMADQAPCLTRKMALPTTSFFSKMSLPAMRAWNGPPSNATRSIRPRSFRLVGRAAARPPRMT